MRATRACATAGKSGSAVGSENPAAHGAPWAMALPVHTITEV